MRWQALMTGQQTLTLRASFDPFQLIESVADYMRVNSTALGLSIDSPPKLYAKAEAAFCRLTPTSCTNTCAKPLFTRCSTRAL